MRPADKTENLNRTVQFVCSAYGEPTPNIRWYRDGELLNTSSRIRIDINEIDSQTVLSLLNIQDTVISDGGMYSCVGENVAGRAESSFIFSIICKLLSVECNQSTVYILFF